METFQLTILDRDQQIINLKEELGEGEALLQEIAANRDDFRQDVEHLEEKLETVETETKFLKHQLDLNAAAKAAQEKKISVLEAALQKYENNTFVVEKDLEITNLKHRLKEMSDEKDKWKSAHEIVCKQLEENEFENAEEDTMSKIGPR